MEDVLGGDLARPVRSQSSPGGANLMSSQGLCMTKSFPGGAGERRSDLHTHTTASDGVLTPPALVDLAVERKLSVLAITDHDTTEGIDAAVAHAAGRIELWPGVEISSDTLGTEVHVLGYFVEHRRPDLVLTFDRMQESRLHRAERMVEKLRELGIRVSWDRVLEIAQSGSVGRPHIAQALVEAGYVSSSRDAFDRYLGRNGPAYVERYRLTPEECIHLIRGAGGLAVLAHPIYITPSGDGGVAFDLRSYVRGLVGFGLEGIEAYYNDYTPRQSRQMLDLAAEFGLIPTGGTDFHGGGVGGPLPGEVAVPWASIEAMMAWRTSHGR
jgi:3',5'-nucleoside bisphosphate phosphatase